MAVTLWPSGGYRIAFLDHRQNEQQLWLLSMQSRIAVPYMLALCILVVQLTVSLIADLIGLCLTCSAIPFSVDCATAFIAIVSATILRSRLIQLNKKLDRGERVDGMTGEIGIKGFRFLH